LLLSLLAEGRSGAGSSVIEYHPIEVMHPFVDDGEDTL
jgi:hypothetical protein